MAKDTVKRRGKSGRKTAATKKVARNPEKLRDLFRRRLRQYQGVLGLFNAVRATAVAQERQSGKAVAVIADQLEDVLNGGCKIGAMTTAQLQMLVEARARAANTAAKIDAILATEGASGQNKPPPLPAGIVPQRGGDAAELAVIVVLMMAQDRDQDLNEKMMQVQAQLQAKLAICAELNQLNADVASLLPLLQNVGSDITAQGIQSALNSLQNALDSDNEISEMTSMQLQMLMDARSRLLQTASDMEKSMSDTDMAIVGNIKQ
jgi:hypothetical protein